jgi:hypothetical protein
MFDIQPFWREEFDLKSVREDKELAITALEKGF